MFCIRLAGVTVEIDNRHNLVYEKCRDYLCHEGEPAFRAAVSEAEAQAFLRECKRPMTLPEAEQKALAVGILVNSEEELLALLEQYE